MAIGELHSDPRVRLARGSDVARLARVHVASWHDAYAGIISADNLALTNFSRSVSRFRGYFWRGERETSRIHVLEDGGQVVGYINSGPCHERDFDARGEIYELYLDPRAQGRGGGRKLLSAGLWHLSGRKQMPVLIWALAANHRARRFYAGMRGREVGVGRVKVGDQVLDRVAYLWSDYLPWPEWIDECDERTI